MSAVLLLAACASGGPPLVNDSPVPGTSAQVNGHTTSPLYVGEFVGQLTKAGGACHGSSGATSTSTYPAVGWDVELYIDHDCRVYVSLITKSQSN